MKPKRGRSTRARTERRAAERESAKLADLKARLFGLEPGGSPERPIEVVSASVVEPHATSLKCPRCDGELVVAEHLATVVDGVRLREVRVACKRCGSRRSVWFRLAEPLAN